MTDDSIDALSTSATGDCKSSYFCSRQVFGAEERCHKSGAVLYALETGDLVSISAST